MQRTVSVAGMAQPDAVFATGYLDIGLF